MGEGNGGRNNLPENMKLRGEENYIQWKTVMEDLADANDLIRFVHLKGKAPPQADEFDEKVDIEKLATWKAWKAGDASMKLIIQTNVKKTPSQLLAGCKSAREM
jgi:hypothetical protein